jgi:hypothetical protein
VVIVCSVADAFKKASVNDWESIENISVNKAVIASEDGFDFKGDAKKHIKGESRKIKGHIATNS